MKIIFNDAKTLQVQSCKEENGQLCIRTISASLEELREMFSDSFACQRLDVVEQNRIIDSYEGYTTLYRLEEYTGKIYGVVMNKIEEITPDSDKINELEEMLNIIMGVKA